MHDSRDLTSATGRRDDARGDDAGGEPRSSLRSRSLLQLFSTVADQGMWSLAGFLTTVAVGRFLGAESLGAFAVGLSVLYGIGGFYTSLVMEPSAVLGPAYFADETRRYAGSLIAGSALVLAPLLPIGIVVATVSDHPVAVSVGAALAVTPATLSAWAARRCVYLTSEARLAGVGSAAYLAAVVGGLLLLYFTGQMRLSTVFFVNGLAALLQVGIVATVWKPDWSGLGDPRIRARIAHHHWTFGKWLVAANAASWVVQYGYGTMIAVVVSLSEAGGFRAAQNLLNSVGLVYVALAYLYTPQITAEVKRAGAVHVAGRVRRLAYGMSAVGLLLFVPSLFAGDPIMRLLYGAEFSGFGWVLAAMSGVVVLSGAISALTIGLQALENSKSVFHGQVAGAILALTLGLAAGVVFGLTGVVAALLCGTVLRLLILRRSLIAKVRHAVGSRPVTQGRA